MSYELNYIACLTLFTKYLEILDRSINKQIIRYLCYYHLGGSFTCPRMLGNFPDPEDCSKYYTCLFFVATSKTCPANKLFDAVKADCKPEKDVHCGDRGRPGK